MNLRMTNHSKSSNRAPRWFSGLLTGGLIGVITGMGGCNLFPQQEVKVWMQDLKPPENPAPDRVHLAETIRKETGVQEFAFSEDLYTSDPAIPILMAPLLRLMLGK